VIRNNCPICNSPSHQRIAEIPFASGGVQVVVVCRDCGMGFAQVSPDADYQNRSRYAEPNSTGSGHPLDRQRLEGFADNFEKLIEKDERILDIGCGQGALLTGAERARIHRAIRP
jgi:ribosomal protein L11 methylase PrmA